MKQNKHGPNTGFGATRGDPGISGNCKRGRAPCPSTYIPFPLARQDGVADWLFTSCLTRRMAPEWERYAVGISFNAVRSSTLTGLKKVCELSVYVVPDLGMIRDLSACVAPDSVKLAATRPGLKKTRDLSVYVVPELGMIRDLSACAAPDSVKLIATLTGLKKTRDRIVYSQHVGTDNVKLANRYVTATGLNLISDLSACAAPDSVNTSLNSVINIKIFN